MVRVLKLPVYDFVRRCDIASLVGTLIIMTIGSLLEDFITTDILALFICVGSIKMFKFKTLKQSIICLMIDVTIISVVAAVLHFIL